MKFVEIHSFLWKYFEILEIWPMLKFCWNLWISVEVLLKFYRAHFSLSEIPLIHITVHYTPVCRDQHAQTHWYTYSHIMYTCIYTYTLVYVIRIPMQIRGPLLCTMRMFTGPSRATYILTKRSAKVPKYSCCLNRTCLRAQILRTRSPQISTSTSTPDNYN